MSITLTPTPPVQFCVNRLRQSIAEPSRFTDDDLVEFINDGYRDAAERSACFLAVTTISFTTGFQEAALPGDWSRTLRVFQAGLPLNPTAYQDALAGVPGGYYQYGSSLGLTNPSITGGDVVYLLYAQVPALLTLQDAPAWGTEWNYLLRHYAAWRCLRSSGGAQDIGLAGQERTLYDIAVNELRKATNRSLKSAPRLVGTLIGAG